MRRTLTALLLASATFASGCAYGGIQAHNDKLYIARQDYPVFGVRSLWECSVDGANLTCVKLNGRP